MDTAPGQPVNNAISRPETCPRRGVQPVPHPQLRYILVSDQYLNTDHTDNTDDTDKTIIGNVTFILNLYQFHIKPGQA